MAPDQYDAIKNYFLRKGLSDAEASKRAAMIYNSKHPKNPVGPNTDRPVKKTRKKKA